MLIPCYCHRYLKCLVGPLRPIWVHNVLKNTVLELLHIYAHVGLCVSVCTSKVYFFPGSNQIVSWIKPNFQWELISFILLTWHFFKSEKSLIRVSLRLSLRRCAGQGCLPSPDLWFLHLCSGLLFLFFHLFFFFPILTALFLPCSTWFITAVYRLSLVTSQAQLPDSM